MSAAVGERDERSASYAQARRALLARPGTPGPGRRRELSGLTDQWLGEVFAGAAGSPQGLALVAVGGFGRQELSPGSDLDLLLLADGRRDANAVASRLWYPVWDSGVRLDHAVRTPEEARRLARSDLAVLIGLLDARLVAGDEALLAPLKAAVLADWRASALTRLPELHEACSERWGRAADVAHALEPDLKEGRGGLRDVVALRAVAASWVADRPHGDLDASASQLLDIRDALHLTTGRGSDRLALQEQDAVAQRLGLADADSVLRTAASAARTVAYASEVTWRRVDAAIRGRQRRWRARRPQLRQLEAGLYEHDGELVLGSDTRPDADPVLILRAAAAAAHAGLTLAQATLARLVAECPPVPQPWPREAREAFVALLGAGEGLVPVWEALDQAGVVVTLVPEWAAIRSRPQRTAVHVYRVDRHSVEAAVRASAFLRRVARPDLLLVGALLHDIGKGRRRGDHSREGAKLVPSIAERLGFPPADVETLVTLVREHLLLPEVATRRDLDDPTTVGLVADAVGSVERLELLAALTEADALAAGPTAWTEWRAALVRSLVERVRGRLHGEPAPEPPPLSELQRTLVERGELAVHVEPAGGPRWTVTVVAPDQRGLLAAVAGVLALHKLSVRAATMRTEGDYAVDTWQVDASFGDAPALEALREDVRRALGRTLDVAGLLRRRDEARRVPQRTPVAAATVDVVAGASSSATVLEVRAADRLGLLHTLGRALSLAGVSVRSARVSTIGAEVVDVFYVVDEGGRPLGDVRAREVARILRDVAS